MLEIIILILLSDKISKRAKARGFVSTGKFVVLIIAMWIFFEYLGMVIGRMISANLLVVYAFGIACAIFGARFAFLIVDNVKVKKAHEPQHEGADISLPFEIPAWKDSLLFTLGAIALTVFLALYLNFMVIIAALLIFYFYELLVYKYTFDPDGFTIHYLYGRTRRITADQVVRIILTKKNNVEINWKKSRKHSTRTIRISSEPFYSQNLPLKETVELLQASYGKHKDEVSMPEYPINPATGP